MDVFRIFGLLLCTVACAAPAYAAPQPGAQGASSSAMAGMSKARYLGSPDLALTAALVEAGGGATHFSSARVLETLIGNDPAVTARFYKRYGSQRIGRFATTFDYAINDSLRIATKAGVTLPAPSESLSKDGGRLCAALVRAGTLHDGRFDVGYMIEKLVSRPIHIGIMHDMDADAAVGPQPNADFHVILTGAIEACQTEYGL